VRTTEVVVGRIGKPHGIRGELSVEVRTDEPERRFADGAVLATQTPQGTPPRGPGRPTALTVRTSRRHQSRLLVTFEEIAGRTQAEAVRGLMLVAAIDADESPEAADEFYDHQLLGLAVVTEDGARIGELAEIVHGAAQDLLVVRTAAGLEVLVPFVSEIVPRVDLAAGIVEVADRPGLLTAADGDGVGGS
jgi:16S rRNA processing protein RimM